MEIYTEIETLHADQNYSYPIIFISYTREWRKKSKALVRQEQAPATTSVENVSQLKIASHEAPNVYYQCGNSFNYS